MCRGIRACGEATGGHQVFCSGCHFPLYPLKKEAVAEPGARTKAGKPQKPSWIHPTESLGYRAQLGLLVTQTQLLMFVQQFFLSAEPSRWSKCVLSDAVKQSSQMGGFLLTSHPFHPSPSFSFLFSRVPQLRIAGRNLLTEERSPSLCQFTHTALI